MLFYTHVFLPTFLAAATTPANRIRDDFSLSQKDTVLITDRSNLDSSKPALSFDSLASVPDLSPQPADLFSNTPVLNPSSQPAAQPSDLESAMSPTENPAEIPLPSSPSSQPANFPPNIPIAKEQPPFSPDHSGVSFPPRPRSNAPDCKGFKLLCCFGDIWEDARGNFVDSCYPCKTPSINPSLYALLPFCTTRDLKLFREMYHLLD